MIIKDFRCQKCHKLLGRFLECRHLEIKCPRCGAKNYLRDTAALVEIVKNTLTIATTI